MTEKKTADPTASREKVQQMSDIQVNTPVDLSQDAITLPLGYAWLPDHLNSIVRDIVNHAIRYGKPDWLDIELEMHDDKPEDCTALHLAHDGVEYRVFVAGWAPRLRDDAHTLLCAFERIYQSTTAAWDIGTALKTRSGALEVLRSRAEDSRALLDLDDDIGQCAGALKRRVQDPAQWNPIPVGAELCCVVPAAWLDGGAR